MSYLWNRWNRNGFSLALIKCFPILTQQCFAERLGKVVLGSYSWLWLCQRRGDILISIGLEKCVINGVGGFFVNNDISLDGRCGIFQVAGGQLPQAVMKLKSLPLQGLPVWALHYLAPPPDYPPPPSYRHSCLRFHRQHDSLFIRRARILAATLSNLPAGCPCLPSPRLKTDFPTGCHLENLPQRESGTSLL